MITECIIFLYAWLDASRSYRDTGESKMFPESIRIIHVVPRIRLYRFGAFFRRYDLLPVGGNTRTIFETSVKHFPIVISKRFILITALKYFVPRRCFVTNESLTVVPSGFRKYCVVKRAETVNKVYYRYFYCDTSSNNPIYF